MSKQENMSNVVPEATTAMPTTTKQAVRTVAHERVRSINQRRFSRIIPLNTRADGPSNSSPKSPTRSPTRVSHIRSASSASHVDDFDFGDNSTSSQGSSVPEPAKNVLEGPLFPADADGVTAANTSSDDASVKSQMKLQRSTSSASERIIELRGSGKHGWFPPLNQLETGSSLIIRRLQKNKERQSQEALKESEIGLTELKQDFARRSYEGVNWEFWAHVVGDYNSVARTQPEKLRKAIQDGFPQELRGLLWQVISSSKSNTMEHLYQSLSKEENAPSMNAISKDLDRTPMSSIVDRDSLARLLKAYSLFDPEVGYTQGMAFIAVPILMELHEAEAFSLFTQLMKVYDFRSLFIHDMPGLHLKLYQFDRLVEDNLEMVHKHLMRKGVHSSMYASQWFLTMFAYRFPPELVTRIFDIVIAEGMEAILRFALALMQASAKKILQLESLDELLPFLKDRIFDGHEKTLVRLASDVVLSPQMLSKYELEYQELNRLEKERIMQMDVLRDSNTRLSLQNKQLEATLESLNKEHIQIANKMVANGVSMMNMTDENFELKERVASCLAEIAELKKANEGLEEKLKATHSQTIELERAKVQIEKYQEEIRLLKLADGLQSNADIIKEVEELRETKKRYEAQLGSLQEAMANALDSD